MNIDAGRRAKRHEPARGSADTGRRHTLLVAPRLQPGHPSKPPRAVATSGAAEPGVGVDIAVAALPGRQSIAAIRMTRLRHDSGIVPAIGEQESELVAGEEVHLVHRAP